MLIENGKIIKKYKHEYLDKLDVTKGMIKKTEFGKDFFDVNNNLNGGCLNE